MFVADVFKMTLSVPWTCDLMNTDEGSNMAYIYLLVVCKRFDFVSFLNQLMHFESFSQDVQM